MDTFKFVVVIIIKIMILLTTIQIYLQINKIWKRKNERKVVDSQSFTGGVIQLIGSAVSVLYYLYVENDVLSVIDSTLYLVQAVVITIIATGIFIENQKGVSLLSLIKKSLRLEKSEATYLLKKIFKPKNAKKIIDILHYVSMIDNILDKKERGLIEGFAREWNIEYKPENYLVKNEGRILKFKFLKGLIEEYLDDEPSNEQVTHLIDIIFELVKSDGEVSKDEEIVTEELAGILSQYTKNAGNIEQYTVLIVPQHEDHHDFVNKFLPDSLYKLTSGGSAYLIGSYYSEKYANMICEQYRKLKMFTIVRTSI